MKKLCCIGMLLLACVLLRAQETYQYADTLNAADLTHKADDSFLLDLINKQAQDKAAQDSILHEFRLQYDSTTIFPLHIGYADSIRIAQQLRRQYNTTVLCLPQLYQPAPLPQFKLPEPQWRSVSEQDSSWPSAEQPVPDYGTYRVRQEARRYLTTHAAALYTGMYDADRMADAKVKEQESKSIYELEIAHKSLIKDAEADREERLSALKNQRNPWYKELNTLLQFTQNYVSGNWYEGGNSSFSMYASVKGKIKYDDKKRITWENTLEWNEGLSTTRGDSIHKVNTSEDLFRLYSKLGVKIVPKLYGSFSAEYRSQVLPTYQTNSKMRKTTFMTPVRFNLALGVDYKPIKQVSLVFSPAAFKLVYANDTLHTNYTDFGIAKGEHVLADFGSSVRAEANWKPLREIALEAKFYAYTNYKMVELDLEINCDFIINRYMSTRIKLHPRYDSSHIVDGQSRAHMQFKELISVGFAHKFY